MHSSLKLVGLLQPRGPSKTSDLKFTSTKGPCQSCHSVSKKGWKEGFHLLMKERLSRESLQSKGLDTKFLDQQNKQER